jgi:hypothetical protein
MRRCRRPLASGRPAASQGPACCFTHTHTPAPPPPPHPAQAYGARNFSSLGVVLQRALLIC